MLIFFFILELMIIFQVSNFKPFNIKGPKQWTESASEG